MVLKVLVTFFALLPFGIIGAMVSSARKAVDVLFVAWVGTAGLLILFALSKLWGVV